MLPCFSAPVQRRFCGFTAVLVALLSGAGTQTVRADQNEQPPWERGAYANDAVDASSSSFFPGLGDLIAQLPDGEAEPSTSGEILRLALPAPARSHPLTQRRHRLEMFRTRPARPETPVGATADGIVPPLTADELAGMKPSEPPVSNDSDVQPGDPVATFQPTPNLTQNGLAYWHRPETDYNGLGFDLDAEQDRTILLNHLSRDWNYGAWRFTPSVGYERDTGGSKARMLYIGPALGYRHQQSDGTVIEPHLGIKGRWDLDPVIGLDSDALSPSLDAKFEAGVQLQDFTGWSLDASASVGGVGDRKNSVDWRGNLGVTVPLN